RLVPLAGLAVFFFDGQVERPAVGVGATDAPVEGAGVLDVHRLGRRVPAAHAAEVHVAGVEHNILPAVGRDLQLRRRGVLRPDDDGDAHRLGPDEALGVHVDVDVADLAGLQGLGGRSNRRAAAGDADVHNVQRHRVDVRHGEALVQLRAVGDVAEVVRRAFL